MIERARATYEACKLVAQSIRLPEPVLYCDECGQRKAADEMSVGGDDRICQQCEDEAYEREEERYMERDRELGLRLYGAREWRDGGPI